LASLGSEAAGAVLRLKARMGDGDSEVVSECLSGLLAIDSNENLPVVSQFLVIDDEVRCEAAALALGKSRLPEALGPLRSCWERSVSSGLRERLLLAIAMLRQPAATEFLLELVASDSDQVALAALSALKIHSYDARLRERIAQRIGEPGTTTRRARFERDFPTTE
jgi:HEAT repeat protein